MQQELLIYEADGLSMHGQLFFEPEAGARVGARAGVVVFPEAFGLGPHALDRARRLAADGYVALAADLHGQAMVINDMGRMMAMLGPLLEAPDKLRARATGAFAALTGRAEVDPGRVAAIGFCLGGTLSFELARTGAALAAAVGFHSGLATKRPAEPGGIKARILACIGAEDPMIPAEQRAGFEAEMRAAGADWQLHVYGNTVHSFTNPEADARDMPQAVRYSADADARSWAAMHTLFAQALAS